MLSKDTLSLIQENVEKILEPLGFDLVELKYMQSANDITLRFLVDRIEGGISLDECSSLNSRISQFLDEANIISDKYTLEVSSPGIDRPLIQAKDFKRAQNKKIHLFLKNEHKGKIEIEGRLVRLDSAGIVIADNDKEEFIPFLEINRAKQVII
jgi:ribosome maturation factor RimP